MRGIQFVSGTSSGAAENDEIVKDLETWFQDHQQMCRLISASCTSEAEEVESKLDRLKASVDSGHRLFSMLKSSYQQRRDPDNEPQGNRSSCSIPLSGMNRFDENRNHVASSAAVNQMSPNARSSQLSAVGLSSSLMLQTAGSTEQPRVLPSRTYLKKSGR